MASKKRLKSKLRMTEARLRTQTAVARANKRHVQYLQSLYDNAIRELHHRVEADECRMSNAYLTLTDETDDDAEDEKDELATLSPAEREAYDVMSQEAHVAMRNDRAFNAAKDAEAVMWMVEDPEASAVVAKKLADAAHRDRGDTDSASP